VAVGSQIQHNILGVAATTRPAVSDREPSVATSVLFFILLPDNDLRHRRIASRSCLRVAIFVVLAAKDTGFLVSRVLPSSGGKTVIVCRLPIIGKNGKRMQPIWQLGGNFCRL
jgi:hypothetical protein